MNSPTAALAWELWRRHRSRFLLIAGTVLMFIVVYPMLCAVSGFDPSGREATNEIARKIAPMVGQPTVVRVTQGLWLLFLAAGPVVSMVLTLLALMWIFTFCEFDPKTSDFLSFPVRIFTLPISTSFLFWRLMPAGLVAVAGLYAVWTYCVPMPRLEIFGVYNNVTGWLTLLVLGQGIVWALAAWPLTRTLAWLTALFLFICSPARRDLIESPYLLPPLFLLGVLLARAGLQKMRHGQWQGWAWRWPFTGRFARAELRGPKQFASPAQARLWFEWRRLAAKICCFAIALALLPVVVLWLRAAAGYPPLPADDLSAIALFLVGVTPVIYFFQGISPGRADQSFLLVRPLASGDLVVSAMQANAIGVILSWAVVLALLTLMPWFGDFQTVANRISPYSGPRAAFIIGLVFLTWRFAVINLCFTLTGNRRMLWIPGFLVYGTAAVVFAIVYIVNDRSWLMNYFSWFGAGLLVMKCLLAFVTFRESLKRRLLTPRAVVGYLAVWGLLVAGLLIVLLPLAGSESEAVLPACLAVVLLVPLARIGLAPLALAWSRCH